MARGRGSGRARGRERKGDEVDRGMCLGEDKVPHQLLLVLSRYSDPLASSQWKKEESQNCIFKFARPPPGPVQTVDSGAQPIDYF